MDTYLKLTSINKDKNCNCISPFYINGINGINPITQREYDKQDIDAMKTALYRISNAKGCNVEVCCDPNDPNMKPDSKFTNQFIQAFPKIMPQYQGSQLISIKLSTVKDVKEAGWIDPTPYFICKIIKATIQDTEDTNIKIAVNLVRDCFTDNCNVEQITLNTLLQNAKQDMTYSYVDDARVSQAIMENNISYVKEYIRKYKNVDIPLTNNDYNNRMIHLAAGTKYNNILSMLIALKAKINIQNKELETPIHLAVLARNIENIESLVSQGADLTIPNKNGEIPMFYAMKTGDLRIVKLLYANNSPIQGVDKDGNNLIHYCILNCPSYKENDDNMLNTKSEIIQFLIERGINTEQKNKAGITPLQLVDNQITKEINKKTQHTTKKYKQNIIEHFFNNANNSTKGNDSVENIDINDYTSEHLALLDIQTKLFTNIIRNNPEKYADYIGVDDLPAGAPIEVLDTVCVGKNIIGNEDSSECIAKGGRISKIVNKTTKIKLELLPAQETIIDKEDNENLYYPKYQDKIPSGTIPNNVKSYNASVNTDIAGLNTPMTTGITYSIGTTPDNTVGINVKSETEFSPQPTTPTTTATPTTPTTPTITTTNIAKETNTPSMPQNVLSSVSKEIHPNMLSDTSSMVQQSRNNAIKNSISVATTTIPFLNTTTTTPFTTLMSPDNNKTFWNITNISILLLFIFLGSGLVYGVMYLFREKINL
jgi:ankyrin repeat protein